MNAQTDPLAVAESIEDPELRIAFYRGWAANLAQERDAAYAKGWSDAMAQENPPDEVATGTIVFRSAEDVKGQGGNVTGVLDERVPHEP